MPAELWWPDGDDIAVSLDVCSLGVAECMRIWLASGHRERFFKTLVLPATIVQQ